MKKRYLYTLLFGIPGFFVAGMVTLFAFGAVVGILWLFVFGDNPWPSFSEQALSVLLVLVFLLLWGISVVAGYRVGKNLEGDPSVNWMHVLISGGITVIFILLFVLQQISVGNLGPKSDNQVCMQYCMRAGYSASGMNEQESPDRTCDCYDSAGNQALRVPWSSIDSDAAK